MEPIRVSYSILSAWARGDIDRAVAPFVGGEVEPTPEMVAGRRWHSRWEREAKRTKCLPAVFGGRAFNSPKFEFATKREVKLGDWCVLAGVLDVLDGNLGIDYKTGKTGANDYTNTFQHKVYKALYPEMEKFEYFCMNQHLPDKHPERVSMSIVYLSDQSLEEGIEYVLTHAAELREYLIANGFDKNLSRTREKKA